LHYTWYIGFWPHSKSKLNAQCCHLQWNLLKLTALRPTRAALLLGVADAS